MANIDNPPAFPTDGRIQHGTAYDGMSLRDWFAGQAIGAIVAATSAGQHHPIFPGEETRIVDAMARDAYQIADAMLSARKQEQG